MEKKIFDNRPVFQLYGWVNVFLIAFLLSLLILIFNQVYILSRFQFVIFVGLHMALVFFVKIHYLSIFINESSHKIEIHYNRKFGLKWLEKSRTTLVPLKQLEGYKLAKDSLGLPVITFYKKENEERFELGPFHVGYLSAMQRKSLEDSFGESIR